MVVVGLGDLARLKAPWISWVFPGPAKRDLRVGANVQSKAFSERLTEVLTSTSKSEFKVEHVANAHNAPDMSYAMFLAALLGATPLDVVPYGKKVLIVAEVVVEPGSTLAGRAPTRSTHSTSCTCWASPSAGRRTLNPTRPPTPGSGPVVASS